MLHLRHMTHHDIPFGLELCRLAGWNQLESDWRRLIALEPEGVLVAEEAGHPCGTASTTTYGTATAWIGMVLVHPDFRRRGVGTALMDRCIRHLQDRHIQSIKLDATDQGRPVYLKLGFRDERPIHRCQGLASGAAPHRSDARVVGASTFLPRDLRPADWPAIASMDIQAFGADRLALLKHLSADGPAAVLPSSPSTPSSAGGPLRAYGFARRGSRASYLGPLVAHDADAVQIIARTLLAGLPAGEVYWDLLTENLPGVRLAESLGFRTVRELTRMYLGETMDPGEVDLVYAAAGFELG